MMQKTEQKEQRSLPFFGIGKVLPFLKKFRAQMLVMVLCGLASTGVDLLIPQFQRYALNHFIADSTLDTLPIFIGIYLVVILLTATLISALIARKRLDPNR